MTDQVQLQISQKVRETCIETAKEDFQAASMSGLSAERVMEAAISTIQTLEIENLINKN